jgi:hypothetical protein
MGGHLSVPLQVDLVKRMPMLSIGKSNVQDWDSVQSRMDGV